MRPCVVAVARECRMLVSCIHMLALRRASDNRYRVQDGGSEQMLIVASLSSSKLSLHLRMFHPRIQPHAGYFTGNLRRSQKVSSVTGTQSLALNVPWSSLLTLTIHASSCAEGGACVWLGGYCMHPYRGPADVICDLVVDNLGFSSLVPEQG